MTVTNRGSGRTSSPQSQWLWPLLTGIQRGVHQFPLLCMTLWPWGHSGGQWVRYSLNCCLRISQVFILPFLNQTCPQKARWGWGTCFLKNSAKAERPCLASVKYGSCYCHHLLLGAQSPYIGAVDSTGKCLVTPRLEKVTCSLSKLLRSSEPPFLQ